MRIRGPPFPRASGPSGSPPAPSGNACGAGGEREGNLSEVVPARAFRLISVPFSF
jgi:hypothetical protein